MADNSAEIARLKAILDSGASEVVTDGQRVKLHHGDVRRRLRELIATDDTATVKRPRASSIDLSGF